MNGHALQNRHSRPNGEPNSQQLRLRSQAGRARWSGERRRPVDAKSHVEVVRTRGLIIHAGQVAAKRRAEC